MYEEVTTSRPEDMTIKWTTDDGQIWFIPCDEKNAMYKQYLEWKLTQEVNPDQTA